MEKEDLKKSVTAVIATLESIEIKATYENLDKLLGCQQVLRTIISNLEESNNADSE